MKLQELENLEILVNAANVNPMHIIELDNAVFVATPLDTDAELDRLAALYRGSLKSGVAMLARFGLRGEQLLDRLPQPLRNGIAQASEQALMKVAVMAQKSHRIAPRPAWVETALVTGLGAAGGIGGVTSTAVELPATTMFLMRRIQQVGAAYGFDVQSRNVSFDSLRVFADSGPLASDDGANTSFASVRIAANGMALMQMVQSVAPKLAVAMGRKTALQAVPVLGAAAGASLNLMYLRHYEIAAQVHFGLRRLAVDAGIPHDRVERDFLNRVLKGTAA